ncbi:MAG TPA: hypothetical protein VKB34_23520 [Povalibacter sp.]|nr:hypothetical protein [Povalibacter sp.]
MVHSHRGIAWVVTLALLCLHTPSPSAAANLAAGDPVIEAIWRVQSLPFEYHSLSTYYDCDSLQEKVRAILHAVGAHRSLIVDARCEGGVTNRISARIVLATPVPATEENVRAATTFDTRDELVARLRNVALPTASDITRFPARWQTLSLGRVRDVSLTVGDCDLLRGMYEQVFPKIAVRVTENNRMHCGNYASRLRPNVKVEALVADPLPDNPLAQSTL